MKGLQDRSLAADIGLFLVLTLLVTALFGGIANGSISPSQLLGTFYLALFIHIGFSLCDGSFNARRTATWLLLIAAWLGAEIGSFVGFVTYWGQLSFWLMAKLVGMFGERALAEPFTGITQRIGEAAAYWPILGLFLLGLDLAVMHWGRWRKTSLLRKGIFFLSLAAAAFGLVLAASFIERPAPDPTTTPLHIIPNWYMLPLYALLRSVPNKLAGLLLAFAAMAAPAVWPWMRADELRIGLPRVWLLLCLAQSAVWIALGYLGSRIMDFQTMHATQALAVLYFAFFLIWPPLLRRMFPTAPTR
ncbi:MAG: hypothetical protein HY852_24475 [Bradyrhizobium sp.]|uniref:hypothetical protein n=1 Tax=Bradyrhizobium sp. TaxID=376 RepID=UPI0025B93510|nr:hypothetical protein [Bradyrhizobium sp.]MBI5264963.1 hypothetical protein [Bradyrhizobium sp.]